MSELSSSPRRSRITVLDATALAAVLFLAVSAVGYVTTRAPASAVNIRWSPDADAAERRAARARYALTECRELEARTEACALRDVSARNIEGIVRDPAVEDTHRIDRQQFIVTPDGVDATLTWVAYRPAWVRPWALDWLFVAAAALAGFALLRRLWLAVWPALRTAPARLRSRTADWRRACADAIPRLRAWSAHPRALLWALAVTLLVIQFSAIIVEFARYATDSGHLRAFDEDAALAIDVTQRTRWYNDNEYRFYGPLYYRVAHTLASLAPVADEAIRTHFSLLLTSLLSMYAIAVALAVPLAMSWPMRLLAVALVGAAFLRADVWKEMLFRAHNDWLLSLCAAALAAGLLRLRRRPEATRYLWLSALAMALGLLTKFIFVFFAPAVLLLLVSDRTLRRRLASMTVLTVAFYFLIGAPQSFRVARDLEYLRSLSSGYSQSPDAASVREWLSLIGPQLLWPLAALIAAWLLLSSGRRERSGVERHWTAPIVEVAAIAVPLALLLSQKIVSAHHYYPMPFVAFVLAGAAVVLGGMPLPWSRVVRLRVVAFLAIAVSAVSFGWLVPRELGSRLAAEAACRPEADRMYRFLEERARQGETAFLDPQVPRPSSPARAWTGSHVNNWHRFAEASPDWVVMFSGHAEVYLGDRPAYVHLWTTDPGASETFYRAFQGRDRVTAPDGKTLTLHASYSCGWRVWQVG